MGGGGEGAKELFSRGSLFFGGSLLSGVEIFRGVFRRSLFAGIVTSGVRCFREVVTFGYQNLFANVKK